MKNMVLLIDANIILDVLQDRKAFVNDSSAVWKLCETKQAIGYISTLTFANIVYIMRKELEPYKIEEIYRKIRLIFEFAAFDISDLNHAVMMEWKDFEDAMQSAVAERVHADYIITRNVKDFSKSKVPAFTPAELISRI